MKRLLFAGLVMALFSGSAAFAQNNGGYVDDVYYNGSQAQQDAKAEAKKQKKQKQQNSDDAEYYNSSTGSNDGYNTDGNAQVYNDSYSNGDDSYIDYDDDSYTSRIRRFQYPMYSVGYWGSVYSPFWYDPFYSNPYYSWGGWYTPGFSIGFGWGGGPYWNNCWGMNTWYGYGMFNSWYGGYGGWGGYGGGYWNGYYAGIYDGARYNNGYGRGAVNYGPRGSRTGFTSVGSYGRSSGMRPSARGTNMVEPMSGSRSVQTGRGLQAVDRNATSVRGTDRAMQVDAQRSNVPGRGINRNDAIRLDNTDRAAEVNQNAARQQEAAPTRRGGFFGNIIRGNNDGGMQRSNNNVERAQPSRSYQGGERSQPSRSYAPSSPAPSRSFSSPSSAPSRSFGGGSGGGRMSGGRR
ncbi:MAG: hypothetical protein WC756_15905 [Taibaiella sp.]|jgi:hypothetical protein